MAAPTSTVRRCSAVSPWGKRCGLYRGHDGQHTVLIPSGAPWWPKQPETAEVMAQLADGERRMGRAVKGAAK